MSGEGWIRLHRKTLDSLVNSDAKTLQVWINLLLRASWKPSFFLGKPIHPGQVAFSAGNFADSMGMHRATLLRVLKRLEKRKKIVVKANNRFTVVTLCKWETYQSDPTPARTTDATPNGQQTNSQRTASATHSKKVRREEGKKSPYSPPKGTRRAKFIKPTIAEVSAYCTERNNGIDPQGFIDHYEQVGWVCGKNRTPMKDWRAAVRTWESKRRKDKPASRVATMDDLADFDLVTGRQR